MIFFLSLNLSFPLTHPFFILTSFASLSYSFIALSPLYFHSDPHASHLHPSFSPLLSAVPHFIPSPFLLPSSSPSSLGEGKLIFITLKHLFDFPSATYHLHAGVGGMERWCITYSLRKEEEGRRGGGEGGKE